MKKLSILLLVAISVSASAQTRDQYEELIELGNKVASNLVNNPAKRGVRPYAMPTFNLVIQRTGQFNAWSNTADSTVTIPAVMVDFLKSDEGQLAFVMAHELGHLRDVNCHARGISQRLRGAALQRMCEANADFIGIQYMMAAGYDPSDAAAFMGKMILVSPNQSSVIGIILQRFTSDHPVSLDRIRQISQYARTVCIQRPELCGH